VVAVVKRALARGEDTREIGTAVGTFFDAAFHTGAGRRKFEAADWAKF